MQRSAHILCFLIIALVVLVAPVRAQMKELKVHDEWHGNDCSFKPDKPFFMIRDIYDLENFWPQAHTGEATPGIDFEKYMLLVWCPGSSLFDFRPVRVERFVYKDGAYLVLMEFERKDTGGYWRRPFMATLLPLAKTGDVFILRKEVKSPQQIDWKPMYAIWDMTGERNRPFDVVQLDKAAEAVKFVDQGIGKGAKQSTRPDSAETFATLATPAQTSATEATSVKAADATSMVPVSQPTPQTPASTAQPTPAQPDQVTSVGSSGQSQPAVSASQPSGSPAAGSVKPTSVAPTFAEDPLFGTEFDITF